MKEAILSLLLVGGLGAQEPAPPAAVVTFGDLVAAADADAKSLPPGLSRSVRYLDARSIPARLRKETYGVLCHHANSLSREVKIVKPREVTPWLWAIHLDDYRWSAATWEDLAAVNFYYLVKARAIVPGEVVKKTRQVLKTDKYNRQYYADEEYTENGADVEKEDFIPAPWLPQAKMSNLILLTGSKTPIVRVDQLINQTAIQSDRGKHGYYDWLDIKDRAAAEKLAALDRKAAEDLYREVAAIVPVSGVAPNNRQVFRYATITGSWWETRDAKNSKEKRNAVSNLLGDYQHDAEEIVFTLPNGLAGYFLGDNKGVRQDTAPDFIASDGRSTNQDRRVHVGYSCIACHTDGGLKPIADYSRRIYNPETGLALGSLAVDGAKAKRLESVYLGPLGKSYKKDTTEYEEAIKHVSGMTGADLAKAYERVWSRYLDEPVTLESAAAEAGVTPEMIRLRMLAYIRAKGVIDPVLAPYVAKEPPPVRREHFEERFPLLMLILGGPNP